MGSAWREFWSMAASGLAAVWAEENTRGALFDAMVRKETYATTGPRMMVRFFGGWEFEAADAASRLPADAGYAKGSDGMLLTRSNGRTHLQLGPAIDEQSRRWREHRYTVTYGDARVKGLGACEVTQVKGGEKSY